MNREQKLENLILRIGKYRPEGLLKDLFKSQERKSMQRGHPLPDYTINELLVTFLDSDLFIRLYNNWKDSGFEQNLRPSFDRLDNNKHYSFDNIQLMTWKENNENGNQARKDGYGVQLKPLNQYCVNTGKFLNSYVSASQASRVLGLNRANISSVARGNTKQKTVGEYFFIFMDEVTDDLHNTRFIEAKKSYSKRVGLEILQLDKDSLEVLNEFKNMTEAGKELKLPSSSYVGISKALKDINKYTAYGFRWKYKGL